MKLLATDGMLIKRPLLIGDDFVLTGFKEAEWAKRLGCSVESDESHIKF